MVRSLRTAADRRQPGYGSRMSMLTDLETPGDIWDGLDRVMVLAVDRELGGAPHGVRASIARAVRAAPGRWQPPAITSGIGLLALDGAVLCRTHWGQRVAAELLGPGDVLRPGARESESDPMVPLGTDWCVLTPARFAVLDHAWVARMAPFPEVTGELARRLLERSRRAAELMAIDQVRRLELRIWLVLWRLADRFGRVRPDGVHLEVPLTHRQLAELVCAQRPSVSAAISKLARAGTVRQTDGGWLLTAPPPRGEDGPDVIRPTGCAPRPPVPGSGEACHLPRRRSPR